MVICIKWLAGEFVVLGVAEFAAAPVAGLVALGVADSAPRPSRLSTSASSRSIAAICRGVKAELQNSQCSICVSGRNSIATPQFGHGYFFVMGIFLSPGLLFSPPERTPQPATMLKHIYHLANYSTSTPVFSSGKCSRRSTLAHLLRTDYSNCIYSTYFARQIP